MHLRIIESFSRHHEIIGEIRNKIGNFVTFFNHSAHALANFRKVQKN
jgi:hypothetical protein